MGDNDSFPFSKVIPRRQVLQKSFSLSLGAYICPLGITFSEAHADEPTTPSLKDNLHLQVAQQAKAVKTSDQLCLLLPEGSQANVQPCIDLFKSLTGVDCKVTTTPVDDINAHMFASASGAKADYDIALPATFGIPDLAESGVIADLSALQKKYEPAALKNNTLYQLGDRYRDKFYGYQTDGDSYLLFFNQAMVGESERKAYEDRFGVGLDIPTSWQSLDEQMAFFHEPQKNRYGGALFRTPDYLVWEWWLRFHAKGVLPLAADLSPTIQGEEGVEALEALIEASAYLHPSCATNTLFENWALYAQGQCYVNIGWGGTQKSLNKPGSKVKDQLAFSVPPGDRASAIDAVPYFNWGWNYTVAHNSKHIELAYLFSLFSVCAHPSTLAVQKADGYFDPFRQEHYDDPAIQAVYTEDFMKVHKQSMTHCIPDFYLTGRNTYFSQLRKYLNLALSKDLKPKRALDLAAKSWEKSHRRFGRVIQTEQWRLLRSYYKQSGFIDT